MVCANLVGGTTEQSCIFPDFIWWYQWYEILPNFLHYNSSVPQPFLLLIGANLALVGFLGWKWSLWPVPTWLEVQPSKDVFSWPYILVWMIWNTSELSALQLIRATAILVVDWYQFGPSWNFGLKMELMVCTGLVRATTEQSYLFTDLLW